MELLIEDGLLKSNPELTKLLKDTIGDSFIKHPTDLINFEKYLDDKVVLEKLGKIKIINKEKLANEYLKNKEYKYRYKFYIWCSS